MNVWIQNPFDNLPVEGYRKQRFWLMAEAFVRAGHDVVLWTSDFNHMTKARRKTADLPDERIIESCGVTIRLIPTRPYAKNVGWARVRSHREYARTWEREAIALVTRQPAVRPDFIVASTPTIGGAEMAVRLGRRFGAKTVVDVMDAWPETFERLAPACLQGVARLFLSGLRRRVQRVYREADLVTGVCERYRQLCGRDDYYLAYHGIEREFQVSGSRFQVSGSRFQVSGSRFQVSGSLNLVYAGNLGRTYDLGTVIRGVKELGASLEVAGRGQGESDWKALVRELGMERSVRFHGYLGEGELASLLRSADIGIVPMPADSFVGVPYKFADYAAAGLAIVSSLGGESEELLTRFHCGTAYRPGDVDGFVAAVRRVQSAGPGDVKGLCSLFDARRIYDGYVDRVIRLKCSRRRS